MKVYFGSFPRLKQSKGALSVSLRKKMKKRRFCTYCKKEIFAANSSYNKDSNATLDHVYDRFDIRRFLSREYVLACFKCNSERGRKRWAEHQSIIEEDFSIIKLIN